MANDEIKKQIEEHLNKAVQIQKEIEALTQKIYEEIEKVKELSQKGEEMPFETQEEEKVEAAEVPEVKEEAAEAEIPEAEPPEAEGAELGVDFSKELEKVKKIKEMLEKPEEAVPLKEEVKEEVKIDEIAPPREEIQEPAAEAEIGVEREQKAEPSEAPPSEQEIEVAIGEEPLSEEERVPEIEIEEESVKAPPVEKEPEISVEKEPPLEEKTLEIEEEPAVEVPPLEREPEISIEEKPEPEEEKAPVEAPVEEKPLPQGKEIEESDTMQTMFSGRWKKHWQEKPSPEEGPEEVPTEEKAPDVHERETIAAPAPEEKVEETMRTQPQPEVGMEPGIGAKPEEERAPVADEGGISAFKGRRASDALEVLSKFKKTEPEEGGEVCYYEYNERIIVDSECLINAMQNHLGEGKKLYEKLAQTEAPKDQFFVKQEIIRHQEALRGMIEIATKILEKENSSLPQHTMQVINEKVLKELLENLSMQNWSNQDDFTFFDEYARKIKLEFDASTDPKVEFLKSIIAALGI